MNTTSKPAAGDDTDLRPDPVYVDARREGIEILIAWGIAMAWTLGFCWCAGYYNADAPINITFIAGVPAWVFWGVVVPWIASGLWTLYYSMVRMTDNSLGDEPAPPNRDA